MFPYGKLDGVTLRAPTDKKSHPRDKAHAVHFQLYGFFRKVETEASLYGIMQVAVERMQLRNG